MSEPIPAASSSTAAAARSSVDDVGPGQQRDKSVSASAPATATARPRSHKRPNPNAGAIASGWIAAVVGAALGAFLGNIANGMLGAIILGLIAGIGFGCYFYAKERKEHSAIGQSHTGTLGGVTFTRDRISYAGDSQPIAGANVEVLSSGQISRRFDWGNTITGAALLGPVGAVLGAGEKKTDDRELYLIVTGSQKQWAARLNPKDTPLAHGFAAAANSAAKAATRRTE
jgi:F0F1-type ATP synthase assembly protein I